MNPLIKRIAAAGLLLFSVIFFPAWLSLALAAAFSFVFPFYAEAFFAGAVLDMIGGAPSPVFFGTQHFYLICTLAAIILAELFRRFA